MAAGHITLFATKVPEVAHLPPQEKQRVFEHCNASEPVQRAWQRYWSRPLKIIAVPVVIIAVFGIFTGRGPLWCVGVALAAVLVPFFIAKRHYHRKLSAAVRECALQYITQQHEETQASVTH